MCGIHRFVLSLTHYIDSRVNVTVSMNSIRASRPRGSRAVFTFCTRTWACLEFWHVHWSDKMELILSVLTGAVGFWTGSGHLPAGRVMIPWSFEVSWIKYRTSLGVCDALSRNTLVYSRRHIESRNINTVHRRCSCSHKDILWRPLD